MTSSSDIDGRSGILDQGPAGAFRALGAFGRPAYENFAQLQSMLRGKASPACLGYFARPTFDAEQKEFRWTVPATGAVRRWRELDDAERLAGESALASIGAELAGLREQLRGRGGQSEAYAKLLDEAVKVPPKDGDEWHFLHLVGRQPVAAFWGFETHDGHWFDPTAPSAIHAPPRPHAAPAANVPAPPPPAAARAALSESLPSTPPPSAAELPQSAARPASPPPNRPEPVTVISQPERPEAGTTLLHRPWWIFWQGGSWGRVIGGLLGLLLLAWLLMLLPRACSSGSSVAPAAPALALGERHEQGAPAREPAAPHAAPDNAVSPSAPPAGPLALDGPKDAREAPTSTPGAAQASPQDTARTSPPASASAAPPAGPGATGVSPLQGQWRAGEDLFDQNTGQSLDLTFAFGPDGNGKVTMRRPDGSTCTGAVASRATGVRMTIEGASVPCAGGGSYAPPRVECTPAADGPLLCFGINPDGSRYRMAMRPTN